MTRKLAITLFMLCIVIPTFLGIGYALSVSTGLVGLGNAEAHFTTAHWARMFNEGRLVKSILYTLLLAGTAIAAAVGIALVLLKILFPRLNNGVLPWFYLIPLGIPPIVAAFFGFLILANTGFVARFLSVVHLVHDPSDFPVLINDTLGLGVWLTHVFLAFPFFFLLFLASAQSQKMKVLQEASTTLGATSNYFMKRVIRPLVVRQNAPLIVIWFVFVLGTYEVPLLLGAQKIRPVALVIIDKIRGYSLSSIPVGYAMSAFYALFILLIAYLLVRLINKRYAA